MGTSVFGVSPLGDDLHITLRPADNRGDITITNATGNEDASVIYLEGIKNFTIEGSANGSSLSITKNNNGSAVKVAGAGNITIKNSNLTGFKDVITMTNTNGFVIENNRILRANNMGINVMLGSANGTISNNRLGGSSGAIASGIALVDGSNNIDVLNNAIYSVSGTSPSAAGIRVTGATSNQPLAINIGNNTIGNITTNIDGYASAFEISNARNIKIYHNTVILSSRAAQV
jgi:hypothetical protein